MRLKSHAVLSLAAALSMSVGFVTLGAAKPPADVPVLSTIADLANGQPLRVGSDGAGAYLTTSQVTSKILPFSSGSDWSLTTYYAKRGRLTASNRTATFDLSEQVTAGAFATPIDTPTAMPFHLIAKCSNVNVSLVGMSPGQSAACPGSFRFWAPNGLWYRMSFAQDNFAVDPLKVTCVSADATGCKVWTVTPSGTTTTGTDPNPKNYTKLLHINENGEILAEGGDYYVSFSITFAR
jgi:hypothetical protein